MSLRSLMLAALVASFFVATANAQKCTSPDFQVELIYSAPDIEHPSVVACDDDGNLFVGEDPMDMRGPTSKHFDRVIKIRWDKDGKPIKTVFCDNLAAVFGLIWRDGALYVMHAPLYTVFRDTDGDGVADERKELASGFGPPAGVYGFNDHIVTGTRLGMDGKVYVSVGDKGVPKATGADGTTIMLEGGGVIRMNLDGTQLEVVTSGTRNHLDVAMDSLDNIFTYDNTDDGLGWWTRFTHHVPTGYYGYPYDYHPHPERHLPRMSEHGGGSPVGAACYREAAWPEKYRDAAFHCEWGKGKVQMFRLKKNGATFTSEMEDFLVKEGDEEFRPLDLTFSPDGKHMYLADWNFGGWTNPKVCGRLFRITYTGKEVPPEPARAKNSDPIEAQIKSLGHPAHSERMRAQHELAKLGKSSVETLQQVVVDKTSNKYSRIHAIWALNEMLKEVNPREPTRHWCLALQRDEDPDVRGQAARALGEKAWMEELAKGPSKSGIEARINFFCDALNDADPGVRMRTAISLGRLGHKNAVDPLFNALDEKDEFARHCVIQALRAIGDWEDVGHYLASDNPAIRDATLVAVVGQYDPKVVAALGAAQGDVTFRAQALATLAELHRKADPYKEGWWGTQPAKGKPARSKIHEWECTGEIMRVLRVALESQEAPIRQVAMKALSDMKDPESIPLVTKIALNKEANVETRQDALKTLVLTDGTKAGDVAASIVADTTAPAPLVVSALEALVGLKTKSAAAAIEPRLSAEDASIRGKAIEAFAKAAGSAASRQVVAFITTEKVAEVRKTAIRVAGEANLTDAVPALIEASSVAELNQDATLALAAMPDKRAIGVYLLGLGSKNQQLRDACRVACITLKEQLGPEVIARNKANELSPEMRRELQAVFTAPAPIMRWQLIGPFSKDAGEPKLNFAAAPELAQTVKVGDRELKWKEVKGEDNTGRVSPGVHLKPDSSVWSVAYAAIESGEDQDVGFAVGSDDQAKIIVNGEKVYEFTNNRGFTANQDSGAMKLKKGTNHVYFLCGNDGGPWDFNLAVRQKSPEFAFLFENVSPQLDLTAFRDFALKNKGDDLKGLALFNDLKGVACIKCHAVQGKGGKIGPDLVGVGTKYPREELIRSVLEPSARVAESFQIQTIVTDEGKILTGVIKGENEQEVEIVDANGKSTVVPKTEIDERTKSTVSLMPNGLKDGMTLQDFADIVAYLESLKQSQ